MGIRSISSAWCWKAMRTHGREFFAGQWQRDCIILAFFENAKNGRKVFKTNKYTIIF